MVENTAEKLNTWKEIARYLGRDERTARRWEAARGLPVRRPPGADRSTVYAYPRELEEWLARGDSRAMPRPPAPPQQAPPRRSSRVAIISWVVVALAIGLSGAALLYFGAGPGAARRAAVQSAREAPPDLYMRGVYAWRTRTARGLADAIADFSNVLVRDPDYAPAYVGLADCYDLMPEFGGMTPAQAYPQAKVAAMRAIQLDDSLAGAHAALAFADFWWSHDVAASRREFERSLRLDPAASLTHHWYANTLAMTGDFGEAIAQIDEAERLDPSTTPIRADKALILFDAGRPAQAIDDLKTIESAQPAFAPTHRYLSLIYFAQGDDPDAIDEMAGAARLDGDVASARVARAAADGYRQAGHPGMTQAMLKEEVSLSSLGGYSPFPLARSYASVDPDRSFALLGQSLALGEPEIMALRIEPALRPLHGDRRFAQLLAAAHLPPLN
jgi:tetratricopeptide (TPR) repeat protein